MERFTSEFLPAGDTALAEEFLSLTSSCKSPAVRRSTDPPEGQGAADDASEDDAAYLLAVGHARTPLTTRITHGTCLRRRCSSSSAGLRIATGSTPREHRRGCGQLALLLVPRTCREQGATASYRALHRDPRNVHLAGQIAGVLGERNTPLSASQAEYGGSIPLIRSR